MNRSLLFQGRLARGLHAAILNRGLAVSTPRAADNGIYELRTYQTKPKSFGKYIELAKEGIPKERCRHSQPIGFWSSELGGLNEVVHIWRYDNYAHRSAVRKALSEDEEWIKVQRELRKCHVKQDNLVLNAVPWYDVKPPMTTNGIYELRCYTIKTGKLGQWVHRFQQGLPARCELSEPAGIWQTEIGPLSTVVLVWPYNSLDERIEIRNAAQGIEEWAETVRDGSEFLTGGFNKILIPLPFSPWK